MQPTILDGVRNDMVVAREEIFGPVLAVIPFAEAEEAVELANASIYGLAAGVWTRDVGKAHDVARRLQAGTVWINQYNWYDSAAPFGGFKQSGFGRELGREALEAYTEVKIGLRRQIGFHEHERPRHRPCRAGAHADRQVRAARSRPCPRPTSGPRRPRRPLQRAGLDPARVDQVIFGHGRQAGGGPNTARQIAYRAGVPVDRPAFTVNQACASGLQAVLSAARTIRTGEAEVVLAGGTESMSNTPYLLPRARTGYRLGHAEIVDGMYKDGFNDPLSGLVMGETAEELAEESGSTGRPPTRGRSPASTAPSAPAPTAASTSRSRRSRSPAGRARSEIAKDEHPRDGVTLESLTKLAPVFREGGTVTAGNASGITDGAAAILVASRRAARELGLPVVARLVDWQVVGVDPRIMGIGPVPAVQKLLARTGLSTRRHRGGRAQRGLRLPGARLPARTWSWIGERVNPDGGAIALGHPIGATGTRILVTLLHGMAARGRTRGIATLCVSGGMGIAALVEREAA